MAMPLVDGLRRLRGARRAIRYTAAIALVVAALAVAAAMELALRGAPTAPIFAAVLAAAWLTGFGPAIVAAAVGVAGLDRLGNVFGGAWHVDVGDAAWTLLFLAIVLGMAWLASVVRRRQDEHRRLLEDERLARAATEATSRAKDDFLAMVSHELRSPLTAILGWVELLKSGTLPAEQTGHALEVIERNTLLQAKLIADLLDVSGAVAGKLDIAMIPVVLTDIVRHAVDSAQPQARAAGVTITGTVAAGLRVRGDIGRLEQVVTNLVSNAIKFTPATGRVYVDARRNGRYVEVVVWDTGEGIDPASLPYIFDMFHQGHAGLLQRRQGLGLGLAIARHIVERHGGSIWAHSEGLGHGATLVVRLPAEADRPA